MAPKIQPKMTREQAQQATIARSRKKLTAAAIAVVLLINAALGYNLYQSLVVETGREQLQQLSQQQAEQQAGVIAAATAKFKRSLKPLQSDSAIIAALQNGNSEQLQQLAKTHQGKLAGVSSLRLFALGQANLDRKHAYPILFSELNMLHRAEKGENVKTEARKINKQWLLYYAFSLKDKEGNVIGSALLSGSVKPLQKALSAGGNNLGQSQLTQNFNPRRADIIASSGSAEHDISATVPVVGNHWKLKFTPSPALVEQASVSPIITIAITLLSTVISVAIAIFAANFIAERQLHRQVQSAIGKHTQKGRSKSNKRGKSHISDPMHQSQDVLDVAVDSEDEDILGLSGDSETDPTHSTSNHDTIDIAENIFRSYDIRGLAETEITADLANKIGRALGSEALDQGEDSMVVARDGRNSSPELCSALVAGITSTGCNVVNIGIVPSQLMYFATHHLSSTSSGVMVTASHNPAEYNGFKMIINGVTLADEDVTNIRTRILRSQFHSGQGSKSQQDIMPEYIDRILADVALAGDVHIVVDAGNGATSEAGPLMFEELGCEVTRLYCEFDGNFPNHQPDPSRSENLQDLIAKVAEVGADLGVAFDGDGDRLTVVTPKGRIIWPDQLLMLFARDILSTNPGTDVLFDVKSTRLLNQVISSYGGRPVMWKTGHSHMKAKMIETEALLGGEFSGHIFIKHRWYGFDDGIYACARLLEIMTLRDQSLDELIEVFPVQVASEEILVPVSDARKFTLVDDLIAKGNFQNGEQTTIDGLRVDFGKGWGLVRASNTSAALTLRFEADTSETLQQLQTLFKRELHKIDADLELNF